MQNPNYLPVLILTFVTLHKFQEVLTE